MAFTENLSAFLDTAAGFAVTATYDSRFTVDGIFDAGYAEAALATVGIGGVEPRFLCRAADVDDDPADKTLVIGTTSYTIVRGEPDGTGMVNLILST